VCWELWDQHSPLQATLEGLDLAARTVLGRREDGATIAEEYDALVISTGVTNGFWRRPTLQSTAEIGADLHAAHHRLAAANSVIVVGGGAAAVGSAANMAKSGSGPVTAMHQAYSQIMGLIQQQAALLSYVNAFWWASLIVACLVPLPFLLKKPRPGEVPASGAH